MIDLERLKSIKGKLAGYVDHHDVSEPTISEFMEIVEWAIAIREAQGVPVANPALAYADSYRDMARQGVDNVPIWAVITDLERNIAPLFTTPQLPVEHPDKLRMDWLCAHVVEVRQPLMYGSHAMFYGQCDSDDCEEYHSTLREQVDAMLSAAPKPE